MQIITLKLNMDKIQSAYLFQGKKGRWLDAVLVKTANAEWSDYMVVQDTGQKNRVKGNKRPIIGNGTIRHAADVT